MRARVQHAPALLLHTLAGMNPYPYLRPVLRAAPVAATLVGAAALAGSARARPTRPDQRPPMPPADLTPGRTVVVPGVGEMFVRDTAPHGGDGRDDRGDREEPTIVLLHGWMFAADLNWYTCFQPLSEIGRVIAMDHRGHGRGLRPSAPYRLTDVADDVAALLRHLGTRRVVAVGYSMGGPVAQLLWQRHPDVVRGLVLCATSATFNDSPRDRWIWRLMGGLQLYLRMVPRGLSERLLAAQLAGSPLKVTRMLRPDSPAEVRELVPWFISELDRASAEDVAEAGRELGRYDARGWLVTVDVPTAVLVTASDQLVPASRQRALADLIPGATLDELPLDHDAVVSRPDLFVPALRKAVEQILAA